jgi:nitrogen regulatory protein P-II 1
MFKLEAIIPPNKLHEVERVLEDLRIQRILISEAFDHGPRSGRTGTYRGAPYQVDEPKLRLEMLLSSLQVDEVVDALVRSARTEDGVEDGLITLFEVADAIRIDSGKRGNLALS